ncbi:MAG TPA: PKD domain-containing protein, partial [Chitinophagaceae bacterium]|nr:PKD domain-containing protein [Chitinophagaceae bacterium]
MNPQPVADFDLDKISGCGPLKVKAANKSNTPTCGNNTYQWTVTYANSNGCLPNTSGYTYTSGTSASSANPEFNFTNPGVYTIGLRVIGPGGTCQSAVVTKQVTVKAKPNVAIAALSDICQNSSIRPSASIYDCYSATPSTYEWTFPTGQPATASAADPGLVLFSTAGTHTITLKVTNECGTTTATRTVTVKPSPFAVAPANKELCAGTASGNLNFSSATPGATYSWTNSQTSIGLAAQGEGNINSFPAVNTTGNPVTATITVTASLNGCSGPSAAFTIKVNPVPAAPATASLTYCQNEVAPALTATAAAGHQLLWYTAATGGTGSTTAPTPSTATPQTLIYHVSQKDPVTGCESERRSLTVLVKPSPKILTGTASNTTQCGTSTGSISLSGLTTGTSYTVSYTVGGSVVTQTLAAGANGVLQITGLKAGTYSNIFVTLNDCPSNAIGPLTLSDPNPPVAPTVTGATTLCSGSTLTLNAATASAGSVTYNWSGPNNFSASGASMNIGSIPVNASGTYSVTATIAGCTSPAGTVQVTVNPTPVPPVITHPGLICSGTALNLKAATSTAGAVSYSWKGPGTFSSTEQNPVINNASAAASGTYTVRATLGSCWSESTTDITVNPTPTIAKGVPVHPAACGQASGSITLEGLTAGKTYQVTYKENGADRSTSLPADGNGKLT